ncbi:hypothetical protein GTY68_06730 [Streptomyces sp. SID4926]|nr:hypothetical protein [Streptomyces sp. SID4926]
MAERGGFRRGSRGMVRSPYAAESAGDSEKEVAEDAESPEDTAGFFSLPLLAMACLAHDAGFPIDVESPYIPRFLLSGEWVGEFPT